MSPISKSLLLGEPLLSSSVTALAALCVLSPSTIEIAGAPDRLISAHGLEVSNDSRVFVLFAALNGLGFSDESQRRGPPLSAPVFHPLRIETREATRGFAKALAPIREAFEAHPASIDRYLEAVLAAPGDASELAPAVEALATLAADPALTALFDKLATAQRAHAKILMQAAEADLARAGTILGHDLRAPTDLTVIPNPLDAHGSVRNLRVGGRHYLIVGPSTANPRASILRASIRPTVAALVARSWGGASGLRSHWEGLSVSKRITERYPNGKAYATETLTRVFAFRVAHPDPSAEVREDFVDTQAKDHRLRWTRAMLSASRAVSAGTPIERSVGQILRAARP